MFTARYALSPYIKQIRFVFKGLKKDVGGRTMLYVVTRTREVKLNGLELEFVNWGVEERDRKDECPLYRGEDNAIYILLNDSETQRWRHLVLTRE
jgi:hypothetical protein